MAWPDDIRVRFRDWGTEAAVARWTSDRPGLSIGLTVQGKVIARAPFGVWVDIGAGHPALLLVPEMSGARERRITFDDYPALDTAIDARILWIGDRAEINLSQRADGKAEPKGFRS
jgi:predicted RNA-binding protein with RPS1 domain